MDTLRKTYEIDGEAFICKVPDAPDMWALNGKIPILPQLTPEEAMSSAQEMVKDPSKLLQLLAFYDGLLVLCSISPKFIADSPVDVPPGCVPINEVHSSVRLELGSALLADSKFTKESAKRVVPTSATDAAS